MHQKEVDQLLELHRPLLLLNEVDCTPWTILQDNTNYVNGPEELAAWRTQVRPMIEKMVRWCEKQDEEGRYWLIENPERSRLWQEAALSRLLQRPSSQIVTCHAGAYGALNSKGAMIRKGHNFAGNCPLVLAHLQKKLSQEQQRLCTPLEGRETSLSQEYCPGLVRAIVTGLLDTAQHHDPNRFHTASKTFSTYAVDRFQVNDDLDSWQPILDMVERLFKHTTQRTLLLPHSDPVCQEVKKLVPWHSIERIQVAIQPTLHRFPAHIPHTHRGSALLYNDGAIEIVTEDLAELRFPKGRFQKPVNIGIFWFGLALPIEQQAQPSVEVQPPVEPPPPPDTVDDNPLHRVGMDEMDISFPHDRKYDQSTKTVVSRLHRNLGHPPATELKKLLAMNGIKNQTILAAVDDMTCASCQRTRMPTRPSPAAIPDTGLRQFADSIQLDIVYIRDIAGSNFPVLGVIDECTLLHQAAVLDSRLPSEVLKKFIRIWAQPFGYPLIARLDPDGSFRGEFEEFMDTTGTQTDFIPPEAHHRLGLIERHNATLRDIAERIIDSNAITGPEQMELAITNTVFSKNACTWSTGRPPFIAAFGRIPRRGGLDLLSDDHSLTTGTNTVKIAREQARQAYGEAWNPDPTDLRALRSASENIRSGLFEDETLPVADDPDQNYDNQQAYQRQLQALHPAACFQPNGQEKPHSSLATVHTAQGNPHCQPTANTVVRVQQYSPEHCKFHRTAQQAPMNASDEGITLIDKHFDGATDIYMPYPHTACFQAYKASASYTGDGVSDDTDASQDNMSTSVTPGQPLTRQQQKALDKELPWRVIVDKGGRNGKMNRDGATWHLWCGDVKTAFLQGQPEPREEPLYLAPPRDQISILAKVFPASLYLVKGNIYGLASAPRTWTMHVCRCLKQSGWDQHSLDKMFFSLYRKVKGFDSEILVAVAVVYVDDFLVSYSDHFNKDELLSMFSWGSQSTLTPETPLDFKGKEIHLRYDNERQFFALDLKQEKFIKAFRSGCIKRKKTESLRP
ncbi:unnamed protein product [Durusdinium trenchii]|uniref:Integrase catalytic domain-containing protein n=1 Tax=Durusdinium trenchii TaxID=1381693 RepID=A0ABP0J3N0_9DINO